MATYDNLTLATTTLVFSGDGNASIGAATFDLSTIDFLPNVPLKDQIEVERIFDTGLDTKYASIVFTIEDRRRMFILPKTWYNINENTKILTVSIPSTTVTDNGLYYPYSRTYKTVGNQDINIPQNLSNTTTNTDTNPMSPMLLPTQAIRGPDIVYVRRKTLSKDSIVTFAPGTRLTTTQLNLQFNQLKFAVQELMSRLRNDVIYKYDENAVDGPFLGGGDLKMSSNYIKGVNSPSLNQYSVNVTNNGTEIYQGKTYVVNHEKLAEALVNGTVHRTGVTDGSGVAFTGDHTASGLKITQLAAGVADTDAARMDQIRSASTLTSGTLDSARISSGSLSLGKLSNASGQGYTLPSDALQTVNSTPNTYGQSTPSNTNNMLYATVDNKGRVTNLQHRNMTAADLPDSGVVASTYGDSNTVLTQVTIDSKGRVTAASERQISASDITAVNATALTGTIDSLRLPSGVVTAGTTNIPSAITVDTYGRVTGISGGSILAANVSDFNAQVRTNRLDQMAAPTASVALNSQKITGLATPTASTDAATKGYVDGYAAPLSTLSSTITSSIQSNAVYWDSANSVFTAYNSGNNRRITNVADPSSAQDVVTKNYFTTNALVSSGGIITAGGSAITNMTMRASASITENDAVNYGFIQNLVLTPGTTLLGSTTPQIYRDAWSSLTKTSGHLTGFDRYQKTFTDLGAVNSFMMLLEADSVTKVFVPYSAAAASGTVHDGYFWLDTSGGSTKVLNIWITTGTTPSGNVVTRNFGLSRLVSGSVATTSSTGLVSILSGNDGGIAVDGSGVLSLKQATSTQIGGVKVGTGLTATSGSISVNLTDTTNTTSSTTAASATAVKAAYDLANTVSTNLTTTNNNVTTAQSAATAAQSTATAALPKAGGTMTGKLNLLAPSTSGAGVNLGFGSDPTFPVSGDLWNNSGTLKLYNGTATKTLAFTDSSITGNAATATALQNGFTIALTGAVTGNSGATFNGSGALTFATTLSAGQAVTSLTGTVNQIVASASTGAVTLSLPQNIAPTSNVQFGQVTSNGVVVGSAANTIGTSSGTLTLAPTTATTNITGTAAISSNATVGGTLTVTGGTTIYNNLALSQPTALLTLGTGGQTIVQNAGTAVAGISAVGDMYLRVPTSGKIFAIKSNTTTTAPVAGDELITSSALTSQLANYASASSVSNKMDITGSLSTNNNQVIGTSTNNSFSVKTNNTSIFNITGAGISQFSGNVNIMSTDGTTSAVSLTQAGKISCASTDPFDSNTVVTTKDYVDIRLNNRPQYVDISQGATGTTPGIANTVIAQLGRAGYGTYPGLGGIVDGTTYKMMLVSTAVPTSTAPTNYVVGTLAGGVHTIGMYRLVSMYYTGAILIGSFVRIG